MSQSWEYWLGLRDFFFSIFVSCVVCAKCAEGLVYIFEYSASVIVHCVNCFNICRIETDSKTISRLNQKISLLNRQAVMKSLQKAGLVPQSKFSCHASAGAPGQVHLSFPDIQGVCRSQPCLNSHVINFLAPTRAQGMLISVCMYQTCLEQSIFIFLGQSALGGPSEHLESSKRAIRALKSKSYSRSL